MPLFFACLIIGYIIQNLKTEDMNFTEYVLALQVDYATDAATAELLEQADLGTDYQDWGRVIVDPDTALDVFTKVMCINYDWPMTDKAMLRMQTSYFPVFCVAAYDGYYIYQRHEAGNGEYYLDSTPKIPYVYTDDVNKKYYALNLGYEYVHMLYNGSLTREIMANQGISVKTAQMQVNSQVSDDLMYRYQQVSIAGNNNVNAVYIPMGLTTMTAVNAIEGPSVIAIVDDWDVQSIKPVDAFSIGGARLEPSRMVAGYQRTDGLFYYCYADLLPDGFVNELTNLFTSVTEAAKNGYYCDPYLMM